MTQLARLFAFLPRLAHNFGAWLLLLLAFVIGYDVVGRKFYNTGSVMLQDLEWHLHGAALLLGFGAAYLKDAHVRVDLVREGFADRTKLKLEIAGIVFLMLPYCGLLCWYSIDYAMRAYLTNEGSVSGGGLKHWWIIKSFLTIGFGMTVLAAISVLLRCVEALRRNAPMSSAFDNFQ